MCVSFLLPAGPLNSAPLVGGPDTHRGQLNAKSPILELSYNEAMKAETLSRLAEFVAESNRIEGIGGTPDLEPSRVFLSLSEPTVEDLCEFVDDEAGADLRTEANMNVVVGNHRPPRGGPQVARELSKLIRQAIDNDATPFNIHRRYRRAQI